MNKPNQKAGRNNKLFVAFVAIVFLGSMGGALLYSTGTSGTEAELPTSKIIGGATDAQKQRILFGSQSNPSDRYILLTLQMPGICDMDCSRAKMTLEQMVRTFDPAVYLSEVQSQSSSLDISILMESYRGKNELSVFNQTSVEDFICDNSVYRSNECIIRKMDLGASNVSENETEKTSSGGAAITGNSTGNA